MNESAHIFNVLKKLRQTIFGALCETFFEHLLIYMYLSIQAKLGKEC